MSRPIATWAYTDQYPVGYDFDTESTVNSVKIGLAAVENIEGINWVQFEFSAAAPVNITDAEVTNPSTNNYRVSVPRWADVVGEGNEGQFYYITLDLSAALHDDTYTISEIRIQTGDLVEHTMVLGGEMTSRTVHVWRTPSAKYLDESLLTGANDGSSWTDAWQSHATAKTGLAASDDIVRCRNSITTTGDNYQLGIERASGWLIWVDDNGTADYTHTLGNLKLASFNGFAGIDIFTAPSSNIRTSSQNHISLRNLLITFPDKLNSANWSIAATTHLDLVNCSQEDGYRGFSFSSIGGVGCDDILIDGGLLNNSGTGPSGSILNRVLLHSFSATNCAGTDFTAGTHFDFIHWFSQITETGIENFIAMNCKSYDNGTTIDDRQYPFILLEDSFVNVAIFNCYTHNHCGLQQNIQMSQSDALVPMSNLQLFNNTFLASDAATEGDERGINVSGQGGDATGGFGFGDFWVANNILNTLTSTIGDATEAPLSNIPTHFTSAIFGPNFYSDQDESIVGILALNGSVNNGNGGNDDFALTDLVISPPNLSPLITSEVISTNGIITSVQSEAYFDAAGNALNRNGTDAVGAYQYIDASDVTAPILSLATGTTTGSTTASGIVTTDEANGTLYYLATINTTETAATIKTGSSQAVNSTGIQNVSFSGLSPSTTYYAHYVHDDAATNESNVISSASFTTDASDVTAPILSLATGTTTGSTTAGGTVTTDEGNGTLYYLATINATETAATIKTGSSQAVSGTGVQNINFVSLSPSTTYYAHYVHDDAATNESNVISSASFTTDALVIGPGSVIYGKGGISSGSPVYGKYGIVSGSKVYTE